METDVVALPWSRLEEERPCRSKIGAGGAGEIALDEYAARA